MNNQLFRTGQVVSFDYVNWRGDEHRYQVVVESIELGPYDESGMHRAADTNWVMHGSVLTRDQDPRPDMGPTRRRTFLLNNVANLWVER